MARGRSPGKSLERIRRLFRERGLVCTAQRQQVACAVLETGGHLAAEELHRRLSAAKVRIGLATVYRTLQLLKDNGLISEHSFGDRCRRYEQAQTSHHDHLVCLGCGAVIEFQEPLIERLQEKAARRHGFSAEHHRLELYGYCRACARERGR